MKTQLLLIEAESILLNNYIDSILGNIEIPKKDFTFKTRDVWSLDTLYIDVIVM